MEIVACRNKYVRTLIYKYKQQHKRKHKHNGGVIRWTITEESY